jgi:predicted membrane channel-forming protein YqfA (hemolysin III family)
MQPSCPWHFLAQQPYAFCEAQLCSWVQQPANTYSNLAYLVTAYFIFKDKQGADRPARLFFSWAILALFIFSTLFHASGTTLGKMADVGAMFIISMGLLSFAFGRTLRLSALHTQLIFWAGLVPSLAFLFLMGQGGPLFLAEILFAVGLEVRLMRQKHDALAKMPLIKSLTAFVIAFIMWILDVKKILCWPDFHYLSGHAIWHIFCATALWFVYRAYAERKV